jgi:hypothetical protein
LKQDDLTRLKHVGAARMKLLNDSGIVTIKQLHEMRLEKLAEIKSIGEHYAKVIKDSVAEYSMGKHVELSDKTASGIETKTKKINQDLHKKIGRLHKNLNRVNENLKPLWEKKYLGLYVDFKKRLKKLKVRLGVLGQVKGDLSKTDIKKIIKNADSLNSNLKKVGKKPKKKKYKKTTQEVQTFSRLLRDIIS